MGDYFGNFLLSKKAVTEDQLKRALSVQADEHYKVGEIAGFSGVLTEEQIQKIIEAMKDEKYANKRFCEVALEMKLVEQNEFADILILEEELNIRIGKILVDLDYLKQEECDKCLEEFKNA